MLSAQTILDRHSDVFTFLHGDLKVSANHCHIPEEALIGSLVYVSNAAQLCEARRHQPAIIIVPARMSACVERPRRMRIDAALQYKAYPWAWPYCSSISTASASVSRNGASGMPTAVVHPEAVIGKRVFLGPYCVVGAKARDRRQLHDRRALGHRERRDLGERTILHPHVFVGADCRIGDDCELHPHTSIGSDGFGYAVDADGRARKIAHLGNVQIGDRVEIGSNCAVDRATLTSTHIRAGTKLDKIRHVATTAISGRTVSSPPAS